MTHLISWESKGVYVKFYDYLTHKEYLALLQKLCADPRFDSIHYLLNHFSDINGHNISEPNLEELISIFWANSLSNKRLLHALIGDSPNMISLAKRFNAASPSGEMFHIFANLHDAREWVARQPWQSSNSTNALA